MTDVGPQLLDDGVDPFGAFLAALARNPRGSRTQRTLETCVRPPSAAQCRGSDKVCDKLNPGKETGGVKLGDAELDLETGTQSKSLTTETQKTPVHKRESGCSLDDVEGP